MKSVVAIANAVRTAVGGLLQVVGPAAGTTRTMTVPDANFTAARTDAAQTFTGAQTFSGNIGIGGATPTTSGTGITFPSTQSASTNANTLDDYEEGTWTPVLADSANNQATMTVQQGFYTKIGNMVYLWCQIAFSDKGTMVAGNFYKITGMPFASKANTGGYYYGGVAHASTSTTNIIALNDGGGTAITFQTIDNFGTPELTSTLDTSGRIEVTLSYVV